MALTSLQTQSLRCPKSSSRLKEKLSPATGMCLAPGKGKQQFGEEMGSNPSGCTRKSPSSFLRMRKGSTEQCSDLGPPPAPAAWRCCEMPQQNPRRNSGKMEQGGQMGLRNNISELRLARKRRWRRAPPVTLPRDDDFPVQSHLLLSGDKDWSLGLNTTRATALVLAQCTETT